MNERMTSRVADDVVELRPHTPASLERRRVDELIFGLLRHDVQRFSPRPGHDARASR
jgi:hypothetical protein